MLRQLNFAECKWKIEIYFVAISYMIQNLILFQWSGINSANLELVGNNYVIKIAFRIQVYLIPGYIF